MSFDPTKHMSKLDRLDLSEEKKRELIHSLNAWAKAFVGRSFRDLPVQVLGVDAAHKDSARANNALHSKNIQTTKGARDA